MAAKIKATSSHGNCSNRVPFAAVSSSSYRGRFLGGLGTAGGYSWVCGRRRGGPRTSLPSCSIKILMRRSFLSSFPAFSCSLLAGNSKKDDVAKVLHTRIHF